MGGDSLTSAFAHVVARLPNGGEVRQGQIDMAVAVEHAIDERRHLIVQAGTGIGKSLGYLVPAILSGSKVVVSTATKALQDQLCVGPSTRILTADLRHVRADEIFVGQELVGFDEERDGTRRRYRRSVVESVSQIEQPAYEIEFGDGTVMTASEDHLWLVGHSMETKWVTTKGLAVTSGKRPGSRVLRLSDVWKDDRSWEGGYLAGLYDGEGCLQQRRLTNMAGGHFNSLTFSQAHNECLETGLKCLDNFGIAYSTTEREPASSKHKPTTIVRISRRPDIMRVLGQFRPARLLAKFDPEMLGTIPGRHNGEANGPRVVRKTFLGTRPVVAIKTSTRTYIAEGLASHNCNKDLPFLQKTLPQPFEFTVLKGRSNYVCMQRVKEIAGGDGQMQLDDMEASGSLAKEVVKLVDWSRKTQTGDRSDLSFEPQHKAWSMVSVTGMECPGAAKCPSGLSCFAEMARLAAQEADVVVVNTHLYGSHLASGGHVLPEHDVVIFDEAHELEDIAASALGLEMTAGRFSALARNARRLVGQSDPGTIDELIAAGDRFERAIDPLRNQRLKGDLPTELVEALTVGIERTQALLKSIKSVGDDDPGKSRVQQAAGHLAGDLGMVRDTNDSFVRWVEGTRNQPVLKVAPIDVGNALAEQLWPERTAILTSATIPSGLAGRVGIPADEHDEMDAGSPFDFESQGMLYCATHMPDPRNDKYRDALNDELAFLIEAAGGRTLALFTSYKSMELAAEEMRKRLDVPILVQGDLPKPKLVAEFEHTEAACLFATMGYWQGVDVPGRTLSLVTIDRLPFPRPDEPLLMARRDRAGAAAFRLIDLPRTATLLAQGAGRLIRTASDHGVVAVLDSRLATANYRWDLINALPPMKRTKDRDEVAAFLTKYHEK